MDKIYRQKPGGLDREFDRRWLQLGIGILLEQDTLESFNEATVWLSKLEEHEDSLSRLLFARWLLRSSAEQKAALTRGVAPRADGPSLFGTWLSAINGNHEAAVPNLEQALLAEQPQALNHFFLAVAYLFAGRQADVARQLDLFEDAQNASTTPNSTTDDAQWLLKVNTQALIFAAAKVRERASNHRPIAAP